MPRLDVQPLKGSYYLPKAEFIYPQLVNWAAIHAVVRPFYDGRLSETMRGFPPTQVGTVLYQMFHQRHQQLLALRELGWDKSDHALRTYCLPGIAQFNVKLQSCSLASWCPFCWARTVVNNVFHRVHTALFFDNLEGTWFRKSRQLNILAAIRTDPVPYRSTAKAIMGSIKWQRRFIRDSVPGALGSVLLNTLEPAEESWLAITRLLAIVPADYDRDRALTPGPGITVEYHRTPVRKNRLAAVVGRVCAYPTGLLVGDPELVKQVLVARHKTRLLTSYGILRNDKVVQLAAGLKRKSSVGS